MLDDRFSGRRSYRYVIEERFLNKLVRCKDVGSLSIKGESRKIQVVLLRHLEHRFETSLKERTICGERGGRIRYRLTPSEYHSKVD